MSHRSCRSSCPGDDSADETAAVDYLTADNKNHSESVAKLAPSQKLN